MARTPAPTIKIAEPINKPLAVQLLDKAAGHMMDRAAQYDSPEGERSMGKTVTAFNIITGHTLSEAEGWLFMQTLKDVRQWQTPDRPHHDSIEDGIAYSSLKGEALIKQTQI